MMTAEEKQVALDNLYKIRAVMALISAEREKCNKVSAHYSKLLKAVQKDGEEYIRIKSMADAKVKLIDCKCEQIIDAAKITSFNFEDWKYADVVIYCLSFDICDSVADALVQANRLKDAEQGIEKLSCRITQKPNLSCDYVKKIGKELGLNNLIIEVAKLKKLSQPSPRLWQDLTAMLPNSVK